MTQEQRKLLDFIKRYRADNDGVSLILDEMRVALGYSTKSVVHRMLCELEERGLVRREGGKRRVRNIVPVEDNEFERGRAVGFSEGYRKAIKEFGAQGVKLLENAA